MYIEHFGRLLEVKSVLYTTNCYIWLIAWKVVVCAYFKVSTPAEGGKGLHCTSDLLWEGLVYQGGEGLGGMQAS